MNPLPEHLNGKQPLLTTYFEGGTVYHKESDKYKRQTASTPPGGSHIDDAGQPHGSLAECEAANAMYRLRGY